MTGNGEFSYGKIKEYLTNVMAECIHLQADDDVHVMKILDTIVDCRKASMQLTMVMCVLAPIDDSSAFVNQPPFGICQSYERMEKRMDTS